MDRLLAAVTCLQELDGDDGGLGGDGNQFEEPVGGTDFTVFELEALRLKDAEELLNDPALLVPFDNAPGVLCTGKKMRCEKPPMQRFDTGAGIDLAHVNDGQGQTFRQMPQQFGLRSGQFNGAKTEFELSRASRSLCHRSRGSASLRSCMLRAITWKCCSAALA